jgi:hypothetical protein
MYNIKKTPNAKMVFLQSFLYSIKIACKYLQQNLQEEMGKRERERVGEIWAYKLALRIDVLK